ncbi:MAG: amidohydrolase family protein [Planctomycetes bacterium]|nr:amidohydrolase family protein [Planctomycetota bacterium]
MTGDQPLAGTEIEQFVMQQTLFGAHSHIMTVPMWAETGPHFRSLIGYAGSDLECAAGPTVIGKWPVPTTNDEDYKERYFELWRASRFTGYCRATELACRDLLGVEYREENAEAIGQGIARLVGDDPAASYREVLRGRANIRWLIKDSVRSPEETRDELYPSDFVRFNYRDDELLSIRSRADVVRREQWWGRSVHSVGDLVDGLNGSISSCLETGKITCFKIGLPYERSLAFTEPTLHEAEKAFSRLMNVTPGVTLDPSSAGAGVLRMSRCSAEELRPLQDYLVHRYVRRAEAEGLPVQVHTGYLAGSYGLLSNISVMDMASFIMRYPRVRFDLFHAGWPYTEEHAVIGKEFPNVWLNLAWAWTMNPATMERTLDSWLACVPHKKIFAYGGDVGQPMCEYGYAQQARIGIGRVLSKWVQRGDMTIEDAKEVARDIMLLNGCRFHGLEP